MTALCSRTFFPSDIDFIDEIKLMARKMKNKTHSIDFDFRKTIFIV
jgi:hypothetical protein